MSLQFEREWEAHGLNCRVFRHPDLGHLCGYVEVPDEHPWHGKGYDDLVSVHGGLTYAGNLRGDGWWIGFDCAHFGDFVPALRETSSDRRWTVDGVVDECEHLAEQIAARSVGDGEEKSR